MINHVVALRNVQDIKDAPVKFGLMHESVLFSFGFLIIK